MRDEAAIRADLAEAAVHPAVSRVCFAAQARLLDEVPDMLAELARLRQFINDQDERHRRDIDALDVEMDALRANQRIGIHPPGGAWSITDRQHGIHADGLYCSDCAPHVCNGLCSVNCSAAALGATTTQRSRGGVEYHSGRFVNCPAAGVGVPKPPTDECQHESKTGDEGPVSDLHGLWPVRWKCDGCGAISYDNSYLAKLRAAANAVLGSQPGDEDE